MRKLILIASTLLALGYTATQIETRMEARGVDPAIAEEAVHRATDVAARLAEEGQPTIRTHYLGLTCGVASKAACATAIARALCGDAADGGDAAAVGECETAEAKTFDAERYCRISDGVHTQLGARVRLTAAQAARVADEVAALTALRGVNNADDATWEAALTARGLRRCVEDGGA